MSAWFAVVTDAWPVCPGTITSPAFARRKDAQAWADAEIASASELFGNVDQRAAITARVYQRREASPAWSFDRYSARRMARADRYMMGA